MTTLPWWLASLVANVAIIATEYLNRTAPGGWTSVLPQTAPLIIVAQWCLFVTWRDAPHWLVAWIGFAVGSSVMRLVAVRFAGDDEVENWPLVAACVAGMLACSYGLKRGIG